ncbi:putative 2-alkenal reductase [Candidatus Nitrososphaera gargensis Ga9.2]|uniref:Putative 2-alkenal reductase n=1 Tax=Nitrososphaera gargensis (strain Ga9.2) TaxID=1237085 RepID=K0IH63_NITGG|nr:trypsin-like peptidase domain-containing protein [Candidatus Nitrososphaera gargensis]AFU58173.1 putative 2-alkenal reductase [Candidatus Nitrososphaera gargensis Ga9.2]
MNKAILAASIVVAAVAIFFVYSQFIDLDFGDGGVPIIKDFVQVSENGKGRADLDDSAFQIGQVSTVQASSSELSLPDLFAKVEKSVVQITDSDETNPLDSRLGSGFVYDTNGHIITNYHVVNGGGRLDVTFLDGTVYRATLIGSDPFTDLAVLYVEDVPREKLVPLPLGNSSNIRVGEQVAAIGNPFGLSGSMSAGIVSGVGRLIPTQEAGGFSIPDVIQTDAPINPGNSGGPLLNMRGEVIGINSAIFSTTGQFAGVGFAIPSDTMTKVVPSLITTGSFKHPWLGVSGRDMTPGIADRLNLEEPRGFLVMEVVAGSPAEQAGIRGGNQEVVIDGVPVMLGGDVIISIDDRTVRKIDDILVYLQRDKEVGDELKLTILRDGREMNVTAVLAARPSQQESP